MDKRGIELSVNFLVTLILALVIFAGGIALVTKFFSAAEDKRTDLDEQTEQQIEKLLMDGAKVGIPISKKEVRRGDDVMFGLGIYNVMGSTRDFYVSLSFSDAINENGKQVDAVRSNKAAVTSYVNEHWLFKTFVIGLDPNPQGDMHTIKNNRFKSIPILIDAYPNIDDDEYTEPGTYIFNVNVSVDSDSDGTPDRLYDGHIHKIYVEVK